MLSDRCCETLDECVGHFLHVVISRTIICLSNRSSGNVEIETCHMLFCSMDQVKGVLTLQGEALTQAVSVVQSPACQNKTLI